MNIAALDLGSNSFHLLVVRVEEDGSLTKLASHREVLRLGAVVQERGRLTAESFERGLDAVGRMVSVARAHHAERSIAAGTSALRDAENGPEFCAAVHARHRLPVELLSGEEEGKLVFLGACRAFADTAGRKVVIDIGGGSVEIAAGDHPRIDLVESLPLGFLRLKQTLGGPVEDLSSRIAARVFSDSAPVVKRLWALQPETWVFSGGTARAIAKLMLVGPPGLSAVTLERASRDLATASSARLIELGVDVARSETLGAGVSIMNALVQRIGASKIHISPGGLREGLITREIQRSNECVQKEARISA